MGPYDISSCPTSLTTKGRIIKDAANLKGMTAL